MDDATLSRQGDSLIFSFSDGKSVEDGKEELQGWEQRNDDPHVFTNGDLILETMLDVQNVDMESQTAVLILQATNG